MKVEYYIIRNISTIHFPTYFIFLNALKCTISMASDIYFPSWNMLPLQYGH